MSTLVTGYDNSKGNTVFLKGAGDRTLAKCNYVSLNGQRKQLTEEDRVKILKDMNT